jgi:acid stress chaperone HdeA
MTKSILVAIGVSAALASVARAENPAAANGAAKTTKDKTGKVIKATNPAKMTCEEFLALEEVVKPKVVYWAEGFDRKGKADDATFDVEATDRLVPVIIQVCEQEPKASFWKKMKAEFKKVF